MILLRHGQSEFNLLFSIHRVDPKIEDPRLTSLGHEQAEQAAAALAGEDIRRIIASPYTRALQTAEPLARRLNLPVLVSVSIRERYAFTCDIGTQRNGLQQAWPKHDFSAMEEIWWPMDRESESQVISRASQFRAKMAADPHWRHTIVVSHWGFILALTGVSVQNGEWLRYDPLTQAPANIVWRP